MMKRALLFVLAFGLVGSTVATAAPADHRDINRNLADRPEAASEAQRSLDRHARAVMNDVMSSAEIGVLAVGDLCAIAVIPGPAGSFNIRFSLFNVVFEEIGFTTIDSFLALGGKALIHESVFGVTAPALGTANVEYPSGVSGKGPIVFSFTGFGALEGAAFNTDPDTYDDAAFGATVADMDGTVLEVAYSGGRRCRGALTFNPAANASIALITQTSP